MNVDPRPTWLRTLTDPPCISTKAFMTLSPSPSPRRSYSNTPEACRETSKAVKNGSKMRGRLAASIPAPLSTTSISAPCSGVRRARSVMRPASGVNLMAFSSRWLRASRIFGASTSIVPSVSSKSQASVWPRRSTNGRTSLAASRSNPQSDAGCRTSGRSKRSSDSIVVSWSTRWWSRSVAFTMPLSQLFSGSGTLGARFTR